MSPRRNSIGYSRKRTTRRPELEEGETAVNYNALASELVRRGLASNAILSGAISSNRPDPNAPLNHHDESDRTRPQHPNKERTK